MTDIALWITGLFILMAPFTQAIPGLFDLAQDLADKAQYPEVSGYFRIEAAILRLENPRGTTKGYMPCDIIPGSCDPKVTGVIDYATPNYDFGKDSVPYSRFLLLWDGNGQRSFDINQTMIKDVCGHSTRKVNVRIRAVDKDIISDDTIDRWSCFILTTDPPAADEKSAKWSPEKICKGHNGSHNVQKNVRFEPGVQKSVLSMHVPGYFGDIDGTSFHKRFVKKPQEAADFCEELLPSLVNNGIDFEESVGVQYYMPKYKPTGLISCYSRPHMKQTYC